MCLGVPKNLPFYSFINYKRRNGNFTLRKTGRHNLKQEIRATTIILEHNDILWVLVSHAEKIKHHAGLPAQTPGLNLIMRKIRSVRLDLPVFFKNIKGRKHKERQRHSSRLENKCFRLKAAEGNGCS
jgi:hypothetical protein